MRRFVALILVSSGCCLAQTAGNLMGPKQFQALPARPADYRIAYGTESEQFGELRVPAGEGPYPVVVLIHGGCWRAELSDLHDLGPIADALKAKSIATWNIEYRRLGQAGGGWPGTYQDVGNGVDYLRSIAAEKKLDLTRVIVVGHSVGGSMAMWSAARTRVPSSSAVYVKDPLPLRGVIDLEGPADMAAFIPFEQHGCGKAVVEEMFGGSPAEVPQRYAEASAMRMLPLGVPQILVWGGRGDAVPISLAERYLEAAKQTEDKVRLMTFADEGHFEIATPLGPSWPAVEKEILRMLSSGK